MPNPSSWERLGDALGGDSELEYEKGLSLGANTENALSQASERRAKAKAQIDLSNQLEAAGFDPATARASATGLTAGANLGDVLSMRGKQQEQDFRAKAGDPNIDFATGNRAMLGVASGPVERFADAGNGMVQDKFSNESPTTTPVGAAMIGQKEAAAALAAEHAAHPEKFRYNGTTGNSDIDSALSLAVAEGRLDPSRLNSRTAPILGQILKNNPGINLNRLTADAALQKNSTFQQRTMTLDSIPQVLDTMVSLGHKVGFSDLRSVGKMQAWWKGETNDPDLQEYMAVRNDALMTIASVMRGVGMSDQAHRAEIEAANPTMSPAALDAWMRGQMSSLTPRLERAHKITHLGEGHTNPSVNTPHPLAAPDETAPSSASGAPPIGFVDGGYRFKGGDPNVQANWEPVQ